MTYEEQFAQSDLVVIAVFLSSRETGERDTLPGFGQVPGVIGVISDFESRLVLKGPKDILRFRLHHYTFENTAVVRFPNGPDLLEPPMPQEGLLMFLRIEQDGTYAPLSGQTDPRMSIKFMR